MVIPACAALLYVSFDTLASRRTSLIFFATIYSLILPDASLITSGFGIYQTIRVSLSRVYWILLRIFLPCAAFGFGGLHSELPGRGIPDRRHVLLLVQVKDRVQKVRSRRLLRLRLELRS